MIAVASACYMDQLATPTEEVCNVNVEDISYQTTYLAFTLSHHCCSKSHGGCRAAADYLDISPNVVHAV